MQNLQFCNNISSIFNIEDLKSPQIKASNTTFLTQMFAKNHEDLVSLSKTSNYLLFSLWAQYLSRIPKSSGFEVLSSIDSGDNADD